jgi:hypothetical protein
MSLVEIRSQFYAPAAHARGHREGQLGNGSTAGLASATDSSNAGGGTKGTGADGTDGGATAGGGGCVGTGADTVGDATWSGPPEGSGTAQAGMLVTGTTYGPLLGT